MLRIKLHKIERDYVNKKEFIGVEFNQTEITEMQCNASHSPLDISPS